MAPLVYFVPMNPGRRIGSSSRALVETACAKGHELVGHPAFDCVFVLREEFSKLEIEDNSLEILFTRPFVSTA